MWRSIPLLCAALCGALSRGACESTHSVEEAFLFPLSDLGLICDHRSYPRLRHETCGFRVVVSVPVAATQWIPEMSVSVEAAPIHSAMLAESETVGPLNQPQPQFQPLQSSSPSGALLTDSVATHGRLSRITGSSVENRPRETVRTVFVDDLSDRAPDASQCANNVDGSPIQMYSGRCSLRSAFAYCTSLGRLDYSECAVHLPPTSDADDLPIKILPVFQFISIEVLESTPSLSLYGNGRNIYLDRRAVINFPLFVVSTSNNAASGRFFFHMQDAQLIDFGDLSYSGGVLSSAGPINISILNMLFQDSQAANGGALYVTNALSLNVTDCVFISGASSTAVVYDGTGGAIAVTSSQVVHISNSTFHGNRCGDDGGAIFAATVDYIKISNCTFLKNFAEDNGGAVLLSDINVAIISNSYFYSNTARVLGGSVAISGQGVTLTNCVFFDSRSSENAGAVSVVDSLSVNLSLCVFLNNFASSSGGAVNIENTDVVNIAESLFDGNQCIKDGGAMRIFRVGDLFLSLNRFQSNEAESSGAGLFIKDGVRVQVYDNEFIGNVALGDGGGVCIDQSTVIIISSSNFTGNLAGGDGGGVYSFGTACLTALQSIFQSNEASFFGAGISMNAGSAADVAACTFTDNSAGSDGGGIAFYSSHDLLVYNSTFTSNSAMLDAGAIQSVFCSSVVVDSSDFTSNAAYTNGGALDVHKADFLLVTDNNFNDNYCTEDGGAARITQSSSVNVWNGTFLNNYAVGNAGSIYTNLVNGFELFYCYFIGNTADSDGGALSLNKGTAVYILNSFFVDNYARYDGGVLFTSDTSGINITGSMVETNRAGNNGGAFDLSQCSNVSISACTFSRNRCLDSGALRFGKTMNITISNSSFSENVADFDAGAISFQTTVDVDIFSCKFSRNVAGNDGGSLFFFSAKVVTIIECDFTNNVASFSGGAIRTRDTVSVFLLGCHFTKNSVTDNGGSLSFRRSVFIKLEDCTFYNNTASSGGALHGYNSRLISINNCDFGENFGPEGGSVSFFRTIDLVISDSSFRKSTGSDGGCVHVRQSNGVSIQRSNFSASFAVNGGAVLLALVEPPLLIMACRFQDNTALNDGGAIALYKSSHLNISDSEFVNNEAEDSGGAISAQYSDFITVSNCLFSFNAAMDGGTMYALYSAYMSLKSSEFINSTSVTNGGALSMLYSDYFSVTSSVFWGSLAISYNGGAFYARNSFHGELVETSFSSSNALSGGAIYVIYCSGLLIQSCRFSHNHAIQQGGGICSDSLDNLTVTNSAFTHNVAYYGGAIVMMLNTYDIVQHCYFLKNLAIFAGGAASIQGGWLSSFQNATFVSNTAGWLGGAAFFDQTWTVWIYDSQYAQNFAAENGGAISLLRCELSTVVNTTFTSNEAKIYGGAIISQKSNATVHGSRFMLNVATKGSGSALFWGSGALNITSANYFLGNLAPNGGGAVSWDSHSTNAPIIGKKARFSENRAKYGPDVASNAVRLRITNNRNLSVSNYETNAVDIRVALEDYYGSIVKSNSEAVVTMSTTPEGCAAPGSTAVLAGTLQMRLEEGESHFTSLQAFCSPGYTIPILALTAVGERARRLEFNSSSWVYFEACSRGEIVDDGICKPCENGYTFESGARECKECPVHSSYCHGYEIWVDAGYWRIADTATTLLPCPMGTDSCKGGNLSGNAICHKGYQGALCAVCSDGYAFRSWSATCEDCSGDSASYTLVIAPVTLFLLTMIFILLALKVAKNVDNAHNVLSLIKFIVWPPSMSAPQHSTTVVLQECLRDFRIQFFARMKVHTTFYQIVLATPFVFNISLPVAFTFLLDCVGWLGFRFSESSGTTCIWTFDYVDEVILQTVLPFVIAGVVVTAYFVHKTYYQRYYTGSADVLLERLGSLYNMYSTLLLTLTYLLLTSTVTTIFRMFPCADVDPNDEAGGADMFLRADYSISCTSDRYYLGVAFASAMAIVYVIGIKPVYGAVYHPSYALLRAISGIPMCYAYLLYSAKDDILAFREAKATAEREQIALRLAPIRFLFMAYKPRYWYWELVDTMQRILLAGVLCVVWSGSTWQIIIGMAFMIGYIMMYCTVNPYVSPSNSRMKIATQVQIYGIYFVVLLIRLDAFSSDFDDTVLRCLLVLLTVGNLFFEVGRYLWHICERSVDQKGSIEMALSLVQESRHCRFSTTASSLVVIKNPIMKSGLNHEASSCPADGNVELLSRCHQNMTEECGALT